ncbi:MAG: hypothetical protein HZB76_00110 [Chlamydiae bacterium]|nr:hypothetical protein [Chlamydiota bacterium]
MMERLKALSAWTVSDFVNLGRNSFRAHTHDWEQTSRPQGFKHLPEHLRSCPGWQFQLSSNEHGRVHGFFIAETFYVVWLDRNHKLYS